MMSDWLKFLKVENSLGEAGNKKKHPHSLNILFYFKHKGSFISQSFHMRLVFSLNVDPQINVPCHLSCIIYNTLNCPMISSFILSNIEQAHKDTNMHSECRMPLDFYDFFSTFYSWLAHI